MSLDKGGVDGNQSSVLGTRRLEGVLNVVIIRLVQLNWPGLVRTLRIGSNNVMIESRAEAKGIGTQRDFV